MKKLNLRDAKELARVTQPAGGKNKLGTHISLTPEPQL